MELGVFLPVSGRAAVPEVLADAAQQAENLGYDSVWAAERLVQTWEMNTAYPYKEDQKWQGFVAPDVPFLEPLTTLSFLSGVTKKLSSASASPSCRIAIRSTPQGWPPPLTRFQTDD